MAIIQRDLFDFKLRKFDGQDTIDTAKLMSARSKKRKRWWKELGGIVGV